MVVLEHPTVVRTLPASSACQAQSLTSGVTLLQMKDLMRDELFVPCAPCAAATSLERLLSYCFASQVLLGAVSELKRLLESSCG